MMHEKFDRLKLTDSLVRRSVLITPVNVPKFVDASWRRGADAVQLDLEDSIPPSEKENARKVTQQAILTAAKGGSDVLVRVNQPFGETIKDLQACIYPGLTGIVLPKVETAEDIIAADAVISFLEMERGLEAGSIQIGVLIETCSGLVKANQIAKAVSRIVSLTLGVEDFTYDLGVMPTPVGSETLWAKSQVIMAVVAAGIQPLGLIASMADFADLKGLANNAKQAAIQGYKGASCIHPAQVRVLNSSFSPDPEKVAYAQKMVDLFEQAVKDGRASASMDGKMIDIPIVERAKKLLVRAELIRAKDEVKARALSINGVDAKKIL